MSEQSPAEKGKQRYPLNTQLTGEGVTKTEKIKPFEFMTSLTLQSRSELEKPGRGFAAQGIESRAR